MDKSYFCLVDSLFFLIEDLNHMCAFDYLVKDLNELIFVDRIGTDQSFLCVSKHFEQIVIARRCDKC
jgi:hypothetical protein